jgi:glyoxylase I family protein
MLKGVHHIAIICSNYSISKKFYTEVLKLEILKETYREERKSYKLDLALNGNYIIELFSFENQPERTSRPEANGLRHLAFSVENLDAATQELQSKTIQTEPIRVDPSTGKRFTFFEDPDKLPLELYEE